MEDEVTVLRAGLVLERTGAVVLRFKPGTYENSSVVLCVWANSTYHPFVVWTYDEVSGGLSTGDYYDDLQLALNRFNERTW